MQCNLFGLLTVAFCVLVIFESCAQFDITSGGGHLDGEEFSLSYSIGQVNYSLFENEDYSLNSGIQQAFIISALSTRKVSEETKLLLYPNPCRENLHLKISGSVANDLIYEIRAINGLLIQRYILPAESGSISLEHLAPGTYQFTLLHGEEIRNNQKFIKVE